MNPLILKYLPYLIGAVVAAGLGFFLAHRLDAAAYGRLQSQFSAYQLQVSERETAAQKAARDELQRQIDKANKQDHDNAQIIADLNAKADHAADDLRVARGLLELARKAGSASSRSVPEAKDQPGTVVAAQDSGDRSFVADFAGAVGECRDAINTLRALQDQIRPQL